jgi:hypothetical protein
MVLWKDEKKGFGILKFRPVAPAEKTAPPKKAFEDWEAQAILGYAERNKPAGK